MSFTYKPKQRKKKRAHGFLARARTAAGSKILRTRRRKGRAKLSS